MKLFGRFVYSLFLAGLLLSHGSSLSQTKRPVSQQQSKPKPVKRIVPKSLPAKQKPILLKPSKDSGTVGGLPKKDSVAPTMVAQPGLFILYTSTTEPINKQFWFVSQPVSTNNQDLLFYLFAGMVLLLGSIRYLFPKYFADLFGLFFRVTFRQKAVRERLLENSLPSLMMNGLFICSGGLFLLFISQYYHWSFQTNFWYNLGFWVLLLSAVYGFKFVLLRLMGWLFQMPETSNTYSFIVFMVSKVTGVVLIPFVLLLAFGPVQIRPVLATIALCLVAGMFVYRYLISFPSVKSTLRLNQFHFFLYLCAFEIVPLLLIYKALAVHFSEIV